MSQANVLLRLDLDLDLQLWTADPDDFPAGVDLDAGQDVDLGFVCVELEAVVARTDQAQAGVWSAHVAYFSRVAEVAWHAWGAQGQAVS